MSVGVNVECGGTQWYRSEGQVQQITYLLAENGKKIAEDEYEWKGYGWGEAVD